MSEETRGYYVPRVRDEVYAVRIPRGCKVLVTDMGPFDREGGEGDYLVISDGDKFDILPGKTFHDRYEAE